MRYLILASLVLVFIGCSDTEKNAETSTESLVDSVTGNADIIKDKIDKVVQKSSTVIDSVKNELIIDGKTIYIACASCHGVNGERKALNVSNLLQGQSKDDIITKLNGYKDGTYGGTMKAVMGSQAKLLSKDKIEAVADYISKL